MLVPLVEMWQVSMMSVTCAIRVSGLVLGRPRHRAPAKPTIRIKPLVSESAIDTRRGMDINRWGLFDEKILYIYIYFRSTPYQVYII